jgi:hypothetical protein
MGAVRRRHVLGDRAVPTAAMRAGVACYPLMAEQYLDRGAGDPQFDLLADQGMGYRVVVVSKLERGNPDETPVPA